MDPIWYALINAVIGLIVVATFWIKQATINNKLDQNTAVTVDTHNIVNGQRTDMVAKIALLEEQVHVLTQRILRKEDQ